MKDRFRTLMKALELSSAQTANLAGVSRPTVDNFLAGKSVPNMRFLFELKKNFPEINTNWLLASEGTMLLDKDTKQEDYELLKSQIEVLKAALNSKAHDSKLLLENNYQWIYYHPELQIIEQRFKLTAGNLVGEPNRMEMEFLMEICNEFKPINLVVDVSRGGPVINAEIKEWMHTVLNPELLKYGVKNKAYVVGPDVIAKLSVQTTANSDPFKKFKYKYFLSFSEAYSWLASL